MILLVLVDYAAAKAQKFHQLVQIINYYHVINGHFNKKKNWALHILCNFFPNSIPLSLVSFNSFFQQQNCIPVLFRNYRELVDVQPNIQSSQRLYC